MINEEKNPSEILGERIGTKVKTGINKTVYYVIGVCIIGGISSIYFILRGVKNGWKKAGKTKA